MNQIKLPKEDAYIFHALVYQADMSLVRGYEFEDDLKKFYNSKRLQKIKSMILTYSEVSYFEQHSFIEKFKTKVTKSEVTFIEGEWLFRAIGAFKTLIYFMESLNNIPVSVYANLRTQFMDLAYSLKLKPFPKEIIYFARHCVEEELYMNKDYLWLKELKS